MGGVHLAHEFLSEILRLSNFVVEGEVPSLSELLDSLYFPKVVLIR